MEPSVPQDSAALDAVRGELREIKDLLRELVRAVGTLDESTKDSTTKITAAIQRWT